VTDWLDLAAAARRATPGSDGTAAPPDGDDVDASSSESDAVIGDGHSPRHDEQDDRSAAGVMSAATTVPSVTTAAADDPEPRTAARRPWTQRHPFVRHALIAVSGVAVLGVAGVTVLTLLGRSSNIALIAAQLIFWWLLLIPVMALGVAALVRAKWLAVVSVAVGALMVVAVAPAITARRGAPDWVAGSPTLTVAYQNVYFDSDRFTDDAARLVDEDADVLVIAEATQPFIEALFQAGAGERYPHQVLMPDTGPSGGAIFSKLPLEDIHYGVLVAAAKPDGRVVVGTTPVRIVGVHTVAPAFNAAGQLSWRQGFGQLSSFVAVDADSIPTVVIGDFNANRFHGPFRDLLDDRWESAHEVRGHPIRGSWPGGPLRLGRVDHALFRGDLYPTEVRELPAGGSDHHGMVVTFAVRQR
jgi:endonuclease/exonuclease/phosphatase (EEP) superfamily protein YafD